MGHPLSLHTASLLHTRTSLKLYDAARLRARTTIHPAASLACSRPPCHAHSCSLASYSLNLLPFALRALLHLLSLAHLQHN